MRGISTLQPGSLGCFHGLLAENETGRVAVNTANVITYNHCRYDCGTKRAVRAR